VSKTRRRKRRCCVKGDGGKLRGRTRRMTAACCVKGGGGIQLRKLRRRRRRRRRKIAGAYLPLFGGGKGHKSDEVQRRQV